MLSDITSIPAMFFARASSAGAEPRCRFVHDNSIVVSWDGGVSPCYALSRSPVSISLSTVSLSPGICSVSRCAATTGIQALMRSWPIGVPRR